MTVSQTDVYAKKQDVDNVSPQVETWNTWDKSKIQAQTRVEKAYVRKGVYMFKREPLTANVTWNIASRDFTRLLFAVNVNLKIFILELVYTFFELVSSRLVWQITHTS